MTPRTIIDVKCEKLTFEVGDENIQFLLSKLIKDLLIRTLSAGST